MFFAHQGQFKLTWAFSPKKLVRYICELSYVEHTNNIRPGKTGNGIRVQLFGMASDYDFALWVMD